ncbi:DUF3822 family protein [Hyunsoonleella sp. 2307UL5-6]|uniref:DUF3822 family protein n=1 Tax=Hyunsoonleella sp. 2307UL5-6 TaxID=3384768 RepID=UPI0039BD65DD
MALKKTKSLDTITDKKLSIQISLSGLSFCVLNTASNSITNFEHIPFDKKNNPYEALERIMHYFDIRDYLKTVFDDILVIHENELSTLVPKPLFNADYLADYLKFNSKILKSDVLCYDTLEVNDSVNVYVPYINVNNYIYEAFGEFTFKHYSTLLVEEVLKLEKENSTSKVYAHITAHHFEIIALERNKLNLYNTFEYDNPEDFIYYLLFTIEQLGYNPETIHLVLIGNVALEDDLYNIAYKYIRNISLHQGNITIPNDRDSKYSNFIIANSF